MSLRSRENVAISILTGDNISLTPSNVLPRPSFSGLGSLRLTLCADNIV